MDLAINATIARGLKGLRIFGIRFLPRSSLAIQLGLEAIQMFEPIAQVLKDATDALWEGGKDIYADITGHNDDKDPPRPLGAPGHQNHRVASLQTHMVLDTPAQIMHVEASKSLGQQSTGGLCKGHESAGTNLFRSPKWLVVSTTAWSVFYGFYRCGNGISTAMGAREWKIQESSVQFGSNRSIFLASSSRWSGPLPEKMVFAWLLEADASWILDVARWLEVEATYTRKALRWQDWPPDWSSTRYQCAFKLSRNGAERQGHCRYCIVCRKMILRPIGKPSMWCSCIQTMCKWELRDETWHSIPSKMTSKIVPCQKSSTPLKCHHTSIATMTPWPNSIQNCCTASEWLQCWLWQNGCWMVPYMVRKLWIWHLTSQSPEILKTILCQHCVLNMKRSSLSPPLQWH